MTLDQKVEMLIKQVEDLTFRLDQVEEREERSELFYQASLMRKKTVMECLEAACVKHFDVALAHFRDKSIINKGAKKGGRPWDPYEQRVNAAQQWFLSFMANFFHKPPYAMKNISFYNQVKVQRHKPVYLSGTRPSPKTAEEKKNRQTFLAIQKDTLRIMKEENIQDEEEWD